MLKIWNCVDPFTDRVNFVDDNNVMLGYDLGQSCCEHAYWNITSDIRGRGDVLFKGDDCKNEEHLLENYYFDPDYCEVIDDSPTYDEGGCVLFKLVSWDVKEPDLYLRLVNVHNGYYGHGFTFRGNETTKGVI